MIIFFNPTDILLDESKNGNSYEKEKSLSLILVIISKMNSLPKISNIIIKLETYLYYVN